MRIRIVPPAEAARLTGKDPSGISRRHKAGTILSSSEGVLVVDDQLIPDLPDLVAMVAPVADEVEALRRRVAELEDSLTMVRHELQLERTNAAQDLAALAEMAQRLAARVRQSS